jgi:hypothetical protein
MLAVLAGEGVGPIRIGATVATIERLMELPCEVKTADVCRYVARGVEFNLENGVTKTIHVQRAGRPTQNAAGAEAEFGFFKGGIPPDLRLGMIPMAIQEHLGPPPKVERNPQAGPVNFAEIHYYPGLTIEYDRIENGNLVMGGLLIYKVDPNSLPSASSAPRPTPSAKPKH